jgi:anti-anti-sigma factor
MLDIHHEPGLLRLVGRLDAAQAANAEPLFDGIGSDTVVDMAQLEYISSAGLGLLLKTHKRLLGQGGGLKLVQVNPHIADILHYSGFDRLFEVIPGK